MWAICLKETFIRLEGGSKLQTSSGISSISGDALGLPLAMVIHAVNVFDSVGTKEIFKNLANKYPRPRTVLSDGEYRGEELAKGTARHRWRLSVVLRSDESSKKFSVIPKRWIVERTFSRIEDCRRLSMDFGFFPESALAMLRSSFIMLLLIKFSNEI